MDSLVKQEHQLQVVNTEAMQVPLLLRSLCNANPRSTQQNQTSSPLLRLPPELRNCIYAYAFDSAEFTRGPKWAGKLDSYYIECEGAHLHRVCRQIRSEVHAYRTDIPPFHCLAYFGEERYFQLVNWIGDAQREKLSEIHMSSSIAEALLGYIDEERCYVRYCRRPGVYPLHPALKRIVVTRAGWSTDDELDLDTFLQRVFGMFDVKGLEVQYKEAKSSD